MRKRKICIITGSRAEWGLLYPLAKRIKSNSKSFKLQIIVTGAHLLEEFGSTCKEIERDAFAINEKVKILSSSDSPVGIAKSMGTALMKFAPVYKKLKPDIIVVLGDRYEIFSAVAAAVVARIPIAHISGGTVTEGAFDDYFRHCITKMSHLHFTFTEVYRKRVIQLGEDPKRVFNVGALTLDNILNTNLLSKKKLEEELTFKFNKRNLVVTFHPVTLESNTSGKQFQSLLDALGELKDTNIIFTKTNADTGGRIINKMINRYVLKNSYRCVAFASMGKLRYLSALKYVDAVVGNSSSGMIEAPAFRVSTVNIGDRQKGRLKTQSIIDCEPTKKDIKKALRELYSKQFQRSFEKISNLYGDGNAAKKIERVLKDFNLNNILKKSFYDIKK